MSAPSVVIVAARRTPIGKFLGAFSEVSAVELGRYAAAAAIESSGLGAEAIEETLFGCARQAGLGPNPARQVALGVGVPETATATTLNMACGSGMLGVIEGARRIRAGEAQVLLVGGMESMTRVPFMLPKMRQGHRLGHARIEDGMYRDGFHCPLAEELMGSTAETLAKRYRISRSEQDELAQASHRKAAAAIAAGHFEAELATVPVPKRHGDAVGVRADENVRAEVTLEKLGRLPAVFDPEAGSVTAGNASGITDGATALVLTSGRVAEERGLEVLAAVEAWGSGGVDPAVMGLGPVPALADLERRTGRSVGAYDLVELNEAFAAQVLACDRELKLDHERLNVNGGSIALGHPIGSTGARVVVTLVHELRRRELSSGVATLCISGGQGLALSLARP